MIGIFDSGIGGLSVFREIYSLAPNEDYVYYADNANCPYGDKPVEFIRERASYITELMLSRGAEIIIVACNTATAAAIHFLRNKYDIPFVGMEPAVKPAIENTKTGIIGVLATAGTFKGELYRHTSDKYRGNVKIIERIGKGLVELVESGDFESNRTRETVLQCIRPMTDEGADQIVLGCTHYPFLKNIIQECAPYASIVNPAPAVAAQTIKLLNEHGHSFNHKKGKVTFLASGDDRLLEELGSRIVI